jgi:pectate lyase
MSSNRTASTRKRLAVFASIGVATTAIATTSIITGNQAQAAAPTAHGYAVVNGSTTGGGSGPTVTVTTLAALKTAAGSSTTETILVNGHFTSSGDEVNVTSNKTIRGVGSSSGLTGIGIKLKSVSNVVIQNLVINKVLASSGNGDSIHIEKSNHLFIDHNDLSSDTSHGTDYYDAPRASGSARCPRTTTTSSTAPPASTPGWAPRPWSRTTSGAVSRPRSRPPRTVTSTGSSTSRATSSAPA